MTGVQERTWPNGCLTLMRNLLRCMTDNRKFFLLWITLAVIFIAPHFSFFFLQAHSELSDLAVDALQIRKAKLFHELYGIRDGDSIIPGQSSSTPSPHKDISELYR
jgi:hypothetical protein